jgi:hypothetical protein
VLALLLCAPSSSNVTTSLTSQRVLTLGSSILLTLLLLSSLDTSSLGPRLFNGLYPFSLLSGTYLSPTCPSSTISFIFILDITTRLSPLSCFPLLLYSTFLLRSSLLTYLSTLFLLYSSRSILFSPHLIFFWIPYDGSILSCLFYSSPFFPFPPPPSMQGGVYSTILSRSMRIGPFSMKNISIHR